jgi:hypothetical protein
MGAPDLERLADLAHLLDRALYGITYMASHSTPAEGWEAELTPVASFAADLSAGLRALVDGGA